MVLGNPPYLSQLASATSRGRSSDRGGGPYADAAAEFLVLAVGLARRDGGRVGLVLPQSILGSHDAGPMRARVEQLAEPIWSWWSPRLQFDASVVVCAVGFRRLPVPGNQRDASGDRDPVWTSVVTQAMGIPDLPPVAACWVCGLPGNGDGQLPRRVLRLDPRRRRPPLRSAVGHERGDRSRPLSLGGAAGDVQPPAFRTAPRRRVVARRTDAPLGDAGWRSPRC